MPTLSNDWLPIYLVSPAKTRLAIYITPDQYRQRMLGVGRARLELLSLLI
jgi:hypothetical protein